MIFRRFSGRILPAISDSCKLQFEAKRSFRSDAALEAISNALEEKVPNLVLYNYPSFSGVFSALFAHLYHSRLRLPCLILPFSSVIPFRYTFLSIWIGFELNRSMLLEIWKYLVGLKICVWRGSRDVIYLILLFPKILLARKQLASMFNDVILQLFWFKKLSPLGFNFVLLGLGSYALITGTRHW